MAEKATNPLGEAGKTASRRIKQLREEQRLTYVELAERLTTIGRPIPVLGLRRIERGERRVDVDDLFAFAEVFGVSPMALVSDEDPSAALADAGALLYDAATLAVSSGAHELVWRIIESGQLTAQQEGMIKHLDNAAVIRGNTGPATGERLRRTLGIDKGEPVIKRKDAEDEEGDAKE